ncbi:MAG: FHA domain-containing protein [Planctomycetes bacterium]|nr:FHA domain-containing protein [Planctomycetota bacterium]
MDDPASERHNPDVKLIVEKGPGTGREFHIEGETTIGRQGPCTIVIADTKISREHARVFVEAGSAYVADLGSSNGTFVNGTRVSAPVRLTTGDRVAVGETTFRFHAEPAAAPVIAERPRAASAGPRPSGSTAVASPGDIRVRRRILQFSPERNRPKTGVLIQDLDQRSAMFRLFLWLAGLLAAGALTFAIAWAVSHVGARRAAEPIDEAEPR